MLEFILGVIMHSCELVAQDGTHGREQNGPIGPALTFPTDVMSMVNHPTKGKFGLNALWASLAYIHLFNPFARKHQLSLSLIRLSVYHTHNVSQQNRNLRRHR